MFLLVLLAVYAVVLLATAVLTTFAPFQEWLMDRLGKRVGLGVPIDLDARIRERVRRRTLGGSIGGLIGLLVALGGAALASRAGFFPQPVAALFSKAVLAGLYSVIAVSATGTGLGVGWAALRSEAPRPDEVRIARIRAVTVSDYVPPILRIGAWVSLGFSAATSVVLVASERFTVWLLPGFALVAVGILGLTTFEVVSHRIIARGHPSSGTDELVWSDAFRSEALRDLLYGPVYAVVLGTWFSVIAPGAGRPFSVPVALLPAGLGLFCFAVVGLVYRHTRTWYLEELWPGARRRTPEEEASRIAAVQAR